MRFALIVDGALLPLDDYRVSSFPRLRMGRPTVTSTGAAPVVVHVIEDDESSRIASSRLLKHAGYVVRVYSTGDEFLAQPPTEAGCIVLDLRLPGPSGLDLQQRLTTAENPLPIVFLTGHGDISKDAFAR